MTGNGTSRQNKIKGYATFSDFPPIGEKGIWYFAKDTGIFSYWDGLQYQEQSPGANTFLGLTDTPSSYSLNEILFFGSDGVYSDSELYWDNISKILRIGNIATTGKVNILDDVGIGTPALWIKAITGKSGSTSEIRHETVDANDQILHSYYHGGTRQWYHGSGGTLYPLNNKFFWGSNDAGIFLNFTQDGKIALWNENPQAIFDTTPTTVTTTSYTRPFPSMTTIQMDALINMPIGAGVYDTDDKVLKIYDNTKWLSITNTNVKILNSIDDFNPTETITAETGTYSTSGTAVSGSSSAFTTDFKPGDFIYDDSSTEHRRIASISDDTNATLVSAFTTDVSAGTAVKKYEKLITLASGTKYYGGRSLYINMDLETRIKFSQDSRIEGVIFDAYHANPFEFAPNGSMIDCIVNYRSTIAGSLFSASALQGVLRLRGSTYFFYTNGTLFDIVGSGANYTLLDEVNAFNLGGLINLGTIEASQIIVEKFEAQGYGTGLVIKNGVDTIFNTIKLSNGANLTTNLLEFNGTTQGGIKITDYRATMGTNEKAFKFLNTIAYSSVSVSNCEMNDKDRVFASGSYDYTTPGFKFSNNRNIQNSATQGEIEVSGNSTETVIPAQNAWVEINTGATAWVGDALQRLTLNTADGEITVNTKEDTGLAIDGNITLEPATATKDLKCKLFCKCPENYTVTFTNGTNTINETGTARQNGDLISFKHTAGTLPAELRKDIIYYVINAGANSFQVSYTLGGAAVAFTDDGTPPNTYKVVEEHGSTPKRSIAAGTPESVIPQAFFVSGENVKYSICVANSTDAVNIIVSEAYERTITSK